MAVILAFDSTAIQFYCEIVARSVAQQCAVERLLRKGCIT